jgi:IS5 family transposase
MSLQSLVTTVATYWQRVQTSLFPYLDTAGLTLTPELERLVAILDLLRVEELVPFRVARQVGAPPKDRAPLARAFITLQVLNLPTRISLINRLQTDDALRRLCGWPTPGQVPSEATFCRAFAAFADLGLADLVHAQRVQEWLGDTLVWHQAIDATDIAARETPRPNPEPLYGRTAAGKRRKHPSSGRPVGRPRSGEVVKPPPTRLERQLSQLPEIALLEVPTACDTGCKPDEHGHLYSWIGYKFHVVTNEWGIPLCAVTTAASVHDSQVAIPLLQLAARRVTALYDLMDRGYDAAAIRSCSRALGHVPIIPAVARSGHPPPEVEPDRARQYKGRTVAERFNARLKDEAGGKQVRVRGQRKVHTHLMFGLLVIFADALLRLAG